MKHLTSICRADDVLDNCSAGRGGGDGEVVGVGGCGRGGAGGCGRGGGGGVGDNASCAGGRGEGCTVGPRCADRERTWFNRNCSHEG